ncbi:ScbA/BarX family gamma-butyrolactone biosynthesis protein [Streptomyces sp. cmx-18-6]|uniref:ScbA/BarX family gamma-butyrolactone biosynthesis protein n=1 Tax=Streptomyces sp. cmx-18-6 TaxID=2790930 RepID=UPI00398020B9
MLSILEDDCSSTPVATVLQEQTHKTDPVSVLLKSWRRRGKDAFTIHARWPAGHGFYAPRHGTHDPLLWCETVRQVLPFLSHAAYRVPMGHQLLWRDFTWELRAESLGADSAPAAVDLHVTCEDVKYRKDRASALTLSVEAERDGRLLGRARTGFTIQDRAVYERLRGPYAGVLSSDLHDRPLPAPADPAHVGRGDVKDVVLSPTGAPRTWELRADTTHPYFFDHAVDHAPGMLLLEAARQAACATAHPAPVVVLGMDTAFARYAEFDAPCRLVADPLPTDASGRRRVMVTAQQHARPVASTTVTLAEAPVLRPAG